MELFSSLPFNIFLNKLFHSYTFIIGLAAIVPFFIGKFVSMAKLPSIVGYMISGVILGPSVLNVLHHDTLKNLDFINEIILGFVALNIGLELKFSELKHQGSGIIITILTESFGAFFLVFTGLYLFTGNLPLSLIFGAIAPASAPAGTVAVIKEYKASGKLTKAIYAVVGFDDGLGILIFGLAASIAKAHLVQGGVGLSGTLFPTILHSIEEIGFSIFIGILFALILCFIIRKDRYSKSMFIFIFGFVLMVVGICQTTHVSLILANMVFGMAIANLKSHKVIKEIGTQLYHVLPLYFVIFFTLAGAHLDLSSITSVGAIGLIYIVGRTIGLWAGAYSGAKLGKLSDNVTKYLGMGILSQAGVAIGLSLIVKQDFQRIGQVINEGTGFTSGDQLGSIILTTITGTCLVFELIGPILTKVALVKSGEAFQEGHLNEMESVLFSQKKQFHVNKEAGPFQSITQTARLKTIKHVDENAPKNQSGTLDIFKRFLHKDS